MKYLFILGLLCSCASVKKDHAEPAETFQLEEVSMLAKTSYIRGCIEGMNHLIPNKTKGHRLDICKIKAKKNYLEIKDILKGPITQGP